MTEETKMEIFKEIYEIHSEMVEKTIEVHKDYVRSNHRVNQLCDAEYELKKMIGNHGCTGMGYAVEQIDKLYREQLSISERLRHEYYGLEKTISLFERIVSERTNGELKLIPVTEEIERHGAKGLDKEFEQKEQEAFEKYCE